MFDPLIRNGTIVDGGGSPTRAVVDEGRFVEGVLAGDLVKKALAA